MSQFSRRGLLASAGASLTLAGCGGALPLLDDGDGPGARAGAGNEHFAKPHPNDFPIHGIDVSKWQGNIDWHALKQSGVKFAWIKATEGGDHVDEKFMENWAMARQAGIPRGAYHFVWWCRPHHEEIDWFKRNVPYDADALPPVLDVEANPLSKNCKRTLHRNEVLPQMQEMLDDMEKHYRKRPVIYTTVDFYAHILHPNEFANYPMWVRSTAHPPHVRYPGRRWHFWQYQSDGILPGVKGKIDRNVFHGSARQWQAFLNGNYGAGYAA